MPATIGEPVINSRTPSSVDVTIGEPVINSRTPADEGFQGSVAGYWNLAKDEVSAIANWFEDRKDDALAAIVSTDAFDTVDQGAYKAQALADEAQANLDEGIARSKKILDFATDPEKLAQTLDAVKWIRGAKAA